MLTFLKIETYNLVTVSAKETVIIKPLTFLSYIYIYIYIYI